jgi:hypothetical protein
VTLPPSEVTYQSQVPPEVLPPTTELRRITDSFAFGGTSGAKSDSTTPMPPPASAALRQIVTFDSLSSPSASWNMPPPLMPALLSDMVVFSISASPSALLQKPPPSPPSSRCPASSMPGIRATLPMMVDSRMIRSASGAFANPPPSSAVLRSIVERMTRNSPLEEL